MPKPELTSRGAALRQDKNWTEFLLPFQTRFIHAGSAPLYSQGGEGLLLQYAKEIITVANAPHAPKNYHLSFPLLEYPPGTELPDNIVLAKPCRLLWSYEEMPNVFVFTLDAGTKVWSQGGKLAAGREVGMPFDILWKFALVGEYRRTGQASAVLVR